jgi:NADH-quinone oxidoreductase subunit J
MPDFNWHSVFFLLFALLSCGFALAVVVSSNIVRMAFYLTLSLGATAGLFILAGAEFLGAMQLMIYVGGTLVLLVFGVMLTAQQRFIEMKTGAGDWVLALVSGGALAALLTVSVFSAGDWSEPRPADDPATIADAEVTTQIGSAPIGFRTDTVNQPDARLRRGMSGYLLMFEIVAIHLLVVLVGAAYLARTKKSAKGPQPRT